jgi:beta-lactamase regulating signal transducer with metallopeptidase domain
MNDVLPGILLACTLRGAVLIAVAVIAGPWARRVFGRNGAHWLWLAVLPALLWPLPPRTPFSLQNLWAAKKGGRAGEIAISGASRGVFEAREMTGGYWRSFDKLRMTKLGERSPIAETWPAGKPEGRRWSQNGDPTRWLIRLWLAGVIAALTQLCWRWRRTMRMLGEARPVTGGRGWDLRGLEHGRCVSLAVTSSVRAPALAGIWRPRILIPEGWLQELPDSELESVLLHELGHHVRGDLVWEWLFAIARCVHWMNPAVWLAERMARRERELACDAWALERTAYPAQYGEALLEALRRVQRGAAGRFGLVAMAEDVRQIARRLEWISQYRPSPRWLAAMAWVPAALVLAAVGSDPLAAKAEGAPAPAVKSGAARNEGAVDTEAAADEPLPLAMRSVEVTMRILRLPEAVTRELGWPVAEEGSKGVQRVFSQEDFRKVVAILRATPGVELLPAPRLICRNGARGSVQAVREFRFGDKYKVSAASGLWVPGAIKTVNLGMTVEWEADIRNETRVRLNIVPKLARLIGFIEDGKLTKPLAPPAGTDWSRRLVACDMPVGAGGAPSFSFQQGNADLDLTAEQIAIVFGFRDIDRTAAPGANREETMVNYFTVQMRIAP